ncbi:MAG: hypothetical protein N4A57_00450 [Anaeromicrobium sp.]|uniref:hypothetical protein n=1 Tax=Anaeromicrobium sp. TaxID=1929132 RepID=UPI0025E953DB|nr:hypothetical protein [Anaeromicrobium sp.]MCT4592734.1 hypothetical protein [Anaeromicrobium sp.]
MEKLLKDILGAIENINKEMSGIKTEISDMRTEMSDMKTEISDMKTEISDMKTDISSMKTEISDMKTDISSMKTEISDIKIEMSDMKIEISDLKTGQARIEKKLDSVYEQTAELTEFREETSSEFYKIHNSLDFIKYQESETKEDLFKLKKNLKIIK